MVSSDYGLYMDSIDSDPHLSSSKYKKIQFNKNSYYDEVVPNFFNNLPVDIAFGVKYDNDNDNMFNTFDHQFDDIYQMGCRNIIDNKNYIEEFECFAPLYIGNDGFPKNFVIFRIDGPGILNLNKDNFRSEIVDNLKCVSVFDLTKNTPLGEWIEKNFTKNQHFPISPFYMDFRNLEFSSWNGIDYEVGGYTSKSFFLDTVLEYENTFYDFENLIYNGYKNNKVIFPNIINFSFLFDDTPATPDSLRKWSMNRYMGFYMDEMENIKNVSPYVLPDIKTDVLIKNGNILYSQGSEYPFVDDWDKIKSPYVEINGLFYKIERYKIQNSQSSKIKLADNVYSDETSLVDGYLYKIISPIDLFGLTHSSINNNLIQINSDNSIELVSGNPLISNYDTADVWIIDIDNKYHVIKKIDNTFYIQSDYAFSMSVNKFQYWINSPDDSYRKTIDLDILSGFIPFKIYRCKFSDIKDLDTSIVNTEYSKFEYEKLSELTYTDESKIYTKNYSSPNNPKDYNDYTINGRVTNIPCSSEYTANGELFRINDGDLSPLWRKNSSRVKWGYQNSISSNDYPYLLNNSFISEEFNRTCNPFDPIPNRKNRNLDYFYSVNSSTSSYAYHSLHVENLIDGSIDSEFSFELDRYLDTSYDYFSYFFSKKSTFGDITLNTQKYSIFEKGDNITPNSTLFRGLKFNIQDVEDIKTSEGNIDTINLKYLNTYQGYKFSILLSKNNYRSGGFPGKVVPSITNPSIGGLTSSENSLSWYIIDNWRHDKTYEMNDTVYYYDILYKAATQSNISDPMKNPSTEITQWYPIFSIFWSPYHTYSANDIVYNGNEYYYFDSVGSGYSFWNPFNSYGYNDVVLYQNKTYISTTQSNTVQPGGSLVWRSVTPNSTLGDPNYYWVETNVKTDWSIVEIWSPLYIYSQSSITKPNDFITTPGTPYSIHNGILYQLDSNIIYSSGDIPGISPYWIRVYSMIPDTDFIYSFNNNPILLMNNRYYLCLGNSGTTLENGICIYINKKYKNVLINIFINDSTLNNLSNIERDFLYSDLYSNLTLLNFSNAINDISNKFGFSDYLQYVIINSDGSLNTYNFNNISSLPCLLTCQFPDMVFSRNQSLIVNPISLELSQFKPTKYLDNGNIITIDMLNYYNGNSLSTEITRRKDDPSIISNYSGLVNNIYKTLYRYSGHYSPIFYTIPLFESPGITSSDIGNYKFDTELSNFGMMKERIVSKINIKDNILKLRFNPDIRSIYPMIDEFGYTFLDYFIFKSTWDIEYYIECVNSEIGGSNISNKILK